VDTDSASLEEDFLAPARANAEVDVGVGEERSGAGDTMELEEAPDEIEQMEDDNANAGPQETAPSVKFSAKPTAHRPSPSKPLASPQLLLLSTLFVRMHSSAVEAAQKYLEEHNRAVYLTPAKCLQALVQFERLIVKKAEAVQGERDTYLAGIQKLEEANGTIDRLQEELEKLGPELEAKGAAVEAGMIALDKERLEVEATRQVVAKEAEVVGAQAEAAQAIKSECEQRLAEAEPAY
jgi:hypothetical protein